MFQPAVQQWFDGAFAAATPVQQEAWEQIRAGHHVLIAAPTGSGKTLAAFLCAIDDLVTRAASQPLPDGVQVLYVSPLKALSNDIERNLQQPLAGVDEILARSGGGASGIRAGVRTGDTPPGEREAMRRRPPQILVTTPESLYLLLTSSSGRQMLAGVREVIVDEIHAIASSKRGSHLALSLERLDALLPAPARRIGLSATQKPIARIADFLTGGRECRIVDCGHQRERDLQIELPGSPLAAVMANETWEEIYDRLEALVAGHRTTLVFVNTRRLAERVARHLAERLGEEAVTAHHGSLSRSHRLRAEQALKGGSLRALVATSSLELGIDIGHVDLVCQLGSPGSIAAFIQRAGRSGHGVGATPRARLFPLSRDDLVECVALLRAVQQGQLDSVRMPQSPLDVLAQQVVAEVSAREWGVGDLYALCCRAWPYRGLDRPSFEQVVAMLAEGYATRRGRRSAYLHHDAVNERLKPRPGARLVALQNGGAIPDLFDYDAVLLPQGLRVGTLNEDFAFESIPGDIFQLGNASYRIVKVEQGRVLVEDAHGQPPTIPFWLGDAAGRSDELSAAVSELRAEVDRRLGSEPAGSVETWLAGEGCGALAAQQAVAYLAAVRAALGCIPTQRQVVLERFFDEVGDMHLVIHAPFGSRLMRAWGLALRKRFCRQFNFELQAAALEDSLILSLGETHSFDIETVPSFLKPETVRQVLTQALLDAPMFAARWRWNATIALAVQRMRNGQKVPPQWQRNQAEDLVAVVFPDQLACLENIRGEREIPDHPLVRQAISDCLQETMDIEGLERLLRAIQAGECVPRCLDLTAPSPLSAGIISARPYAFLDDGDAENRRTRAIAQPQNDLQDAAVLATIAVPAIEQVQAEAWIAPRSPDELHDGLLQLGFLTQAEFTSGCSSCGAAGSAESWPSWFQQLAEDLRVACVTAANGRRWWVATERLAEFLLLEPGLSASPDPGARWLQRAGLERQSALVELLRSRLSGLGPVAVGRLADDFALGEHEIRMALQHLQGEGFVIRVPAPGDGQADRGETWCERRLLARIHRYSRERRRHAARAVPPAAYLQFLLRWHGLDAPATDLESALSLLEGWTAPLAAWEPWLLQSRCKDYAPHALDHLVLAGSFAWFRPALGAAARQQIIAATPIGIVPRSRLACWQQRGEETASELPADCTEALALLRAEGAMFTDDLQRRLGVLRPQLEQCLGTLVARGLVTADAFSPLRWLIRPEAVKRRDLGAGRRIASSGAQMLGRWSLVQAAGDESGRNPRDICAALLRRYGIVFRAVLERETLLPAWRDLLACLRRMEDRGEVLGGRFVDGFSGEQFALPEAAGLLRQVSSGGEGAGILTVISATDPLNLGGILTPGVRTPATLAYRILLHEGLPVARTQGQELERLLPGAALDWAEAERRLTTVRPLRHRAHRGR